MQQCFQCPRIENRYWRFVLLSYKICAYFYLSLTVSSKMSPPEVHFVGQVEVQVTWDTSNFHKGGPLIDYEIKVAYESEENYHIFTTSYPATKKNFLIINLSKLKREKVSRRENTINNRETFI